MRRCRAASNYLALAFPHDEGNRRGPGLSPRQVIVAVMLTAGSSLVAFTMISLKPTWLINRSAYVFCALRGCPLIDH